MLTLEGKIRSLGRAFTIKILARSMTHTKKKCSSSSTLSNLKRAPQTGEEAVCHSLRSKAEQRVAMGPKKLEDDGTLRVKTFSKPPGRKRVSFKLRCSKIVRP